MAKQSKAKKLENLGKGKVTPVQIAFIVDRYLADNSYTATLSAFRAEASDLFSKTKGKEVPKGLLGLGEILNEYISLKEQRVMVEKEKRRVEMALQGMQEVMRAYHSAATASLPPSPPLLPPQLVASPGAPSMLALNPGRVSPPGHVNVNPVVKHAQPPAAALHKAAEPNKFSTPVPNSSSGSKRKPSRSALKVRPSPKKLCSQSPADSSIGGASMPSRIMCTSNTQDNLDTSTVQSATIDHQITKSPIPGSSVPKSLFKQPPESLANSSPKTPPQVLPMQGDKSVFTPANQPTSAAVPSTSQEIASSSCTLTTTETIIVSPLKCGSFYAVERSYHVTSPFKSNTNKPNKREHVKGRLDFDESDGAMSIEKPVAVDSSASPDVGEMAGSFDFDLPDLDFFNNDFSFSEFLADIDLDFQANHSDQAPAVHDASAASKYRSEHNVSSVCLEPNQVSPDSSPARVSGVDMNIQGPDNVTTVRTITKRIKIVSPVKAKRSRSLEQVASPGKA